MHTHTHTYASHGPFLERGEGLELDDESLQVRVPYLDTAIIAARSQVVWRAVGHTENVVSVDLFMVVPALRTHSIKHLNKQVKYN